MVSKASEDLPEPETPVTTVRELWGISKSMFLRLWTRAPRTTMLSMDIAKGPAAATARAPPDGSAPQASAEGVSNPSIITGTANVGSVTYSFHEQPETRQTQQSCLFYARLRHGGSVSRWRPA